MIYTIKRFLSHRYLFSHGLCDFFIIWGISALLSFVDLSFLDPTRLIDNFTGEHNRFTTKTFFEIKNNGYEGDAEPSQIFALVDITDLTNRAKIASLIDTVYDLSPQRIAIDLMFQIPQDSITDEILVKTVRRVRDKTVFACMLENYHSDTQSFGSIKHSFFLDPANKGWYCDSIIEGFANMKNDGTNETIWLYSLVEQVGNQRIFSLPAMLLADYPDEVAHTEHIINYDKLNIPIYTPDSLVRENIENKFVVIGSYKNSGDKFDTPLGLLPGMMIHTYIMQSQNTDAIVKQSTPCYIFTTFVILMFFIAFLIVMDTCAKNISNIYIALFLQGGVLTIFVTLLAVYILMGYYYYLFAEEGVFSDGHAALNGILIASVLVKTIYATLVVILNGKKKLPWLTRYSIYGHFKK